MFATLTYPQFHAVFVLPPLGLLLGASMYRARKRPLSRRWRAGAFLVIALLAVGYTTPWDNFLIAKGVWAYGPGRVVARVWHAPVSEYLFFLLQPALTALWLAHLPGDVVSGVSHSLRDRLAGGAAGVAVGLVGLGLLTTDATFYLGAILAWAGPVLALQWAVGWRYLARVRRRVAVAVLVPTAYLCVVDAVALSRGIWIIADRYTTGLALGVVPVEEATFFLVTNLFVVQGLVLFPWVVERWR
jgi:lycopene cyclase domain-containing protein